jgi:hypothetical protein
MSEINYDSVKEPLHSISQELFNYMNSKITDNDEEINAIKPEIERIQNEANKRNKDYEEKSKEKYANKKKLIQQFHPYKNCMDGNTQNVTNHPFKTQEFDLINIENQRLYFSKVIEEINKVKKKYYDIFVEEYNKAKESNPKLPNLPENFTWRNMRLSKGFEGIISDVHGDLTVLLYFIILSGIGDFIPGECSYLSLTNNTRYSQKEFDKYINEKYNLIKEEEETKDRSEQIANFKEERFYPIPLIHINHDFDSKLHLLGDHGDRGNATVQCLELIKDLLYMAPDRITNIVGNHDVLSTGLYAPEYEDYFKNLYDKGKFLTVKSNKIGAKHIIDAHTFLTKKHLRELFTIYKTVWTVNHYSNLKRLVDEKLSEDLKTKIDDFFKNISSDKAKENKFDYEYNKEQEIYNDVNSYNAAYDKDYENTYNELINAGFTVENFLELKDVLGYAYINYRLGNDENDNDEGNNTENDDDDNTENDNDNSGLYMTNTVNCDLTSIYNRIEPLILSTRFMPENPKELLPLTIQFTGHNNMFYIYQIGNSYGIDATRSFGFKTGYSNCNVLIYNPYTNFRYVFADYFQQTNLEPKLMDPKPLPPAISNKPNLYINGEKPEESSLTIFEDNDLRKSILPMFIDSIAPELEKQVITNLNQLFDNENLISTPEELLKFINNDLFRSVGYKIDMSKSFKLNNIPETKNALEIIQLKLAKNFQWNNDCLCALLSLSIPGTIAPELINPILQNFIDCINFIEYDTLKNLIVLSPNSVSKEIMISLLEKIALAMAQITVEDVYDLKSYASNEIEIENSQQFKKLETIATILNSNNEINIDSLKLLEPLGENSIPGIIMDAILEKYSSETGNIPQDTIQILENVCEKEKDSDKLKSKKLETLKASLNKKEEVFIQKVIDNNSNNEQIIEEEEEEENENKPITKTNDISQIPKDTEINYISNNKDEQNLNSSNGPLITTNSKREDEEKTNDNITNNLQNNNTSVYNIPVLTQELQTRKKTTWLDWLKITVCSILGVISLAAAVVSWFVPGAQILSPILTNLGLSSLTAAIVTTASLGAISLMSIGTSIGIARKTIQFNDGLFPLGFLGETVRFVIEVGLSIVSPFLPNKWLTNIRMHLYKRIDKSKGSIETEQTRNNKLETLTASPKNFGRKCLTFCRNFAVGIGSATAHIGIFVARISLRVVTGFLKLVTVFATKTFADRVHRPFDLAESKLTEATCRISNWQTQKSYYIKPSIHSLVPSAKLRAIEYNAKFGKNDQEPLLPNQ